MLGIHRSGRIQRGLRFGIAFALCVGLCVGTLLSLAGPRLVDLLPIARWSTGGAPVVASSNLVFVRYSARLNAADPGGAKPAAPVVPFQRPMDGAQQVARGFDPPARPWLSGHRGVDLAAKPGTTVRAAGSGEVRFAGWIAGRPVVSVEHAGGLRTTYEPVEPVVSSGDLVFRGDPLGRLLPGHPDCPAAACLHWGLRRGSMYLDPLVLLGSGQVRLLPLTRPAAPGT